MTARPPVGTLSWEKAGGPPLSLVQRAALLGGTGVVLVADLYHRMVWHLGRQGLLRARTPRKVDLAAWAPPDSRIAHDAEDCLRAVASRPFIEHSFRSYYFSAIACELEGAERTMDREALYVAILLHDVGLFDDSRPPNEHCFTVGGAREARRIAEAAGWDEARRDRVATAITANLNPFVPLAELGPEAHFFSHGGLTEVIAQEWRVHPENLTEILARHPRRGFAAETATLVRREAKRNPGCRFACFGPLFSAVVARRAFSGEKA